MRRKGFSGLVIFGIVALALGTAALGIVAARRSRSSQAQSPLPAVPKKRIPDTIKPGSNAEASIGANEFRGADYSPAIEKALLRAYPAEAVFAEATLAAQNAWAALSAGAHSPGAWELIGPSKATYPGALNFLGDHAEFVAAGRVTAMGIGPTCTAGDCVIYVGAAGGGIWKTRDGLAGSSQWEFLSTSFGTNAIGSLLIDPSNPNVVYVGTGEPNASGDSEAGVGVYKSTDGGQTWSLVPGSDIFFQRSIGQMALDNAGNLLVPIASGVRGIGSTDGAISSGSTTHPLTIRGLYRQTGATFTRIFTSPAPTRGATTAKIDPTHPGIIYVNSFQGGIWRSTDNGASFSQIFAPKDTSAYAVNNALERDEFDVTTLPSGATRMYVGVGTAFNPGQGDTNPSTFWRSDNADAAATFASLSGAQVDNYCTSQCWYDNLVHTPPGSPDIVYLGGSFDYGHLGTTTNGRGVLLSTDAGASWTDLTQDGDPHHAEFTHPDQHGIVVNPSNPLQYWEGSDGGVVRSDGLFADVSYKCAARGLNPSNLALCKQLLSRVPNKLSSLNNGFSTLQFQSLSVSAKRPNNNLQGGTQDNGTFQYTGSPVVWPQEIYGDGGQSGFSSADDSLRFNTFTGQANDVNFRNGDPTKWCVATGPIVISPEASYFYPPIIADPSPANGGTIFQGSFSVWRTQDWGGSRAYLEANCPEFTTSAANPACGDFVRIGPAGATDLTDTLNFPAPGVYGNDRRGGAVSVIERTTGNLGTVWVATGTGRVFLSDNSNAAAGSVVWTRIDQTATNDPNRFPSSITADNANPHHAWISYSGYNVNTPATPGHVFEITWDGTTATWTDRSYNLEDLPITDLVRDDVTGDLYAASDFGVMRLANGSTTWTVAGSGLPQVEVPGLTIVPSARLLYAATHGRSAWLLRLP